MPLEICVTSLPSAILAEQSGADRIELCTDLSCGGLTPSLDLVQAVIRELCIPVHVLVRCRAGDFCYTAEEKNIMICSAQKIMDLGATGVVIGALRADGSVDDSYIHEVRAELGPKSQIIFHRAIDVSSDVMAATRELARLPIDGILSSGGQDSVAAGMDQLCHMRQMLPASMDLIAGGGLHIKDVDRLSTIDISWIHTSASRRAIDSALAKSIDELPDAEVIRELKAQVS